MDNKSFKFFLFKNLLNVSKSLITSFNKLLYFIKIFDKFLVSESSEKKANKNFQIID